MPNTLKVLIILWLQNGISNAQDSILTSDEDDDSNSDNTSTTNIYELLSVYEFQISDIIEGIYGAKNHNNLPETSTVDGYTENYLEDAEYIVNRYESLFKGNSTSKDSKLDHEFKGNAKNVDQVGTTAKRTKRPGIQNSSTTQFGKGTNLISKNESRPKKNPALEDSSGGSSIKNLMFTRKLNRFSEPICTDVNPKDGHIISTKYPVLEHSENMKTEARRIGGVRSNAQPLKTAGKSLRIESKIDDIVSSKSEQNVIKNGMVTGLKSNRSRFINSKKSLTKNNSSHIKGQTKAQNPASQQYGNISDIIIRGLSLLQNVLGNVQLHNSTKRKVQNRGPSNTNKLTVLPVKTHVAQQISPNTLGTTYAYDLSPLGRKHWTTTGSPKATTRIKSKRTQAHYTTGRKNLAKQGNISARKKFTIVDTDYSAESNIFTPSALKPKLQRSMEIAILPARHRKPM